MTSREQLKLVGHRVLDGGMASELEFLGADISGPLWSAHVLEDAPEEVVAVHRGYLEAGADILLTASYQVSRKGYAEFGLSHERADQALLRAVELAQTARREFVACGGREDILIAASLGPYGAALHNGSEYTGDYECGFDELVQFHRERIAVLAGSEADLLAFETIPSIEEARAIGEALDPWPELAAWFCFNSPDHRGPGLRVAHGELLRECAALAASFPQTVAVGLNCTHPRWLPGLIPELKAASEKPVVVYPNSGEGWDAEGRVWTGSSETGSSETGSRDPLRFGEQAQGWFAAGAQIVGGCCRTRPSHIRQIAACS